MNRFVSACALTAFGLAMLSGIPAALAQVHTIQGQFHGTSVAAQSLQQAHAGAERQMKPVRHPRAVANALQPAIDDPAVQRIAGPATAVVKGTNIDGLGAGFPGFTVCCAPPDTNAAVGAGEVVETVNLSFAVFNKVFGTVLSGPTDLSALFTGVGNNCETGFLSDPTVNFDKPHNRWVITFLGATPGGLIGVQKPFLQCFAVSTTNDARGTYFLYSFDLTSLGSGNAGALNDYGKLAVWPDAYYMGFNEFGATFGQSLGAAPCAFQSAAMVVGASATAVCFTPIGSEDSLFPAGVDGTAPPSGEPAFFVGTLNGSNSFHMWKFHVDFANTANSTFTGPSVLTTAAYSEACGGGTCIPQPAGGEALDSLADRLMYRPAYRNFGTHESIVVTHSVTAGSATGIRWYEIRNPNATPTIFQQGTYAPDSNFRWMGSAAMDKVGTIAVGYSVSSSTVDPSVRVTGRTPSMAPGTLSKEILTVAGGGVQQNSGNRWGDYSSMAVDADDDCTFWYAQEYIKTTGSFNWATRLAAYKLKSCK